MAYGSWATWVDWGIDQSFGRGRDTLTSTVEAGLEDFHQVLSSLGYEERAALDEELLEAQRSAAYSIALTGGALLITLVAVGAAVRHAKQGD